MKAEQMVFTMDNDQYILKSNNLIESSYSLSLNAQRLIYMTARKLKPIYVKSEIKPSQFKTLLATKEFGDIKIYTTEFKREFDLKGNYIYDGLRKVVEELWNSKIQYLEDDGTIVEKRWVITCKYNEDENYVSLTFHPDLILDLLVFKNKYNKLHNDASRLLKNNDQIRTYELLKRYVNKGVRRIDLEEYRYKLAYQDDIYPLYSKLKQRKIVPTIQAINENTDIEIYDFKEIRYGRKIGALEFYVRSNQEHINDEYVEDEDILDINYVDSICGIIGSSVSAGTVNKITDSALEGLRMNKVDMSVLDYIRDKVNVINEYSKYNKVSNKIGAIIHALRTNWTSDIVEPKGQDILDEIACGNVDVDDIDLDEIDFSNKGNYTGNNKKRHR